MEYNFEPKLVSQQARELLADEDRARKVRKATEDVKQFLENLPKKNYEDGWAEDKWEDEAEKHPLFMSKIDESKELPPLVEAFQSLKYDLESNEPAEVAKAHKEDGNEQFKKKKYKLAVTAYSEGLKVKCDDAELNAVLYCNRAAAYYHLGSYNKALEDAIAAKALKPTHIKAIYRGALCYFHLGKYDACIVWCKEGLKLNSKDKSFIDLEKKAENHLKVQEEIRLEAFAEQAKVDKLTKAIKARGINVVKGGLTKETILSDYPGTSAKLEMVDNELIWPVVFLYPQYGVTDFVPNFNENASLHDYFCELFSEQPDWDIKKEYTPDTLHVYFCDKKENLYPVDIKQPLKSVLRHKKFKVTRGVLNYFVTSSEFDKIYRTKNYVVEE